MNQVCYVACVGGAVLNENMLTVMVRIGNNNECKRYINIAMIDGANGGDDDSPRPDEQQSYSGSARDSLTDLDLGMALKRY